MNRILFCFGAKQLRSTCSQNILFFQENNEKPGSMFDVSYEHLEQRVLLRLVGQTGEQKRSLMFEVPYEHLEPSGQIVPSGPMNQNGSLGDWMGSMPIGQREVPNACDKLKQQDQVQFYEKIKHELQVEDYQKMVEKFYQQQKPASGYPKITRSEDLNGNGINRFNGGGHSQTVFSNNFGRPKMSANISTIAMRPAESHSNFIIARNWLGQWCKV